MTKVQLFIRLLTSENIFLFWQMTLLRWFSEGWDASPPPTRDRKSKWPLPTSLFSGVHKLWSFPARDTKDLHTSYNSASTTTAGPQLVWTYYTLMSTKHVFVKLLKSSATHVATPLLSKTGSSLSCWILYNLFAPLLILVTRQCCPEQSVHISMLICSVTMVTSWCSAGIMLI